MPEAPEGATGSKREKLRGELHQGEIVGSFLVEGQPPKGEAGLRLQNMILSGSRYAEQSMEKERIPSDLKEIPKQYFEGITEGE